MAQKNKGSKPKAASPKNKSAKPSRKKAPVRNASLDLVTGRFDGVKSITIDGKFVNSDNNNVLVDVYRPNPDPYDFTRNFPGDFNQVFDQLVSGDAYNVDISVTNNGTFNLTISGDFDASPITTAVTDTFKRLGFVVVIN